MSSSRIGLQACIREKAPLAVYTHCSGHCLNLVISHSCNIPVVTNALDKVQSAFLFFHHSPNQSKVLQQILSCNIAEATKRKPLLELCKTRWAARHTAYQDFYSVFQIYGHSLLKSLVLDNTRIFCQMALLMLPGILNKKTKQTLCYTPLQSLISMLFFYLSIKSCLTLLRSQSSYKVLQLISWKHTIKY